MERNNLNRAGATVAMLLAMTLAACGSKDNDSAAATGPEVKVTELAAGAYAVSAGDVNSPTAGKYYAATDGSRLLVLNNSAQQAAIVYRREAGGNWQMTPAPATANTLDLLNSSAIPSTVPSFASVARSYTVRLSSGAAAALTVGASGDITAGATACKLSGKLSTSALPNVLKASLTASGCGDLPAQSDGYLVADSDYAPAAFRLVMVGGGAPVDLWAYAE